jgi:peptidyl-prolyl cis-trans isomerase D
MEGGAQFETADPRALRGDPFLRPAEPDPAAEPEPVDTGPVGVLDRGKLTHDQLPTEVADAVFAMPLDTISQPLQSDDGWHIFRIDSVELGNILTLEEARGTVTDTLMRNAALEILYDLSIDLDDALGGGDSLEEAANRLGLIPGTATFDNQGLDHDGNPVGDIPAFVTFVSTAFQIPSGGESLLNEAVEGGYFVVRIDGVEAPGPIPFDEVRGEVARDWGLAEQTRLTEELAAQLFDRAKSGTDLAALGAEVGIDFSISQPVTRTEDALSGMSAQLVGELFSIEFGAVAQAPSIGGGTTIGRLVEIIPADPSANPEALANLIAEFSFDMSEDLLTQFQGALEAELGVRVDTDAFLRATLSATAGAVPLAPTRNPIGGF